MDVAPQLQSALSETRERLAQAAGNAARAGTPFGGPAREATMASLAQSAIFSEALMSAMHARLQELKAVTK